MRWRRAIVISLLIGAVATTLIAWTCAIWSELQALDHGLVNQAPAGVVAKVPAAWKWASFHKSDGWSWFGFAHHEDRGRGVAASVWSSLAMDDTGHPLTATRTFQHVESGLPLRCLQGENLSAPEGRERRWAIAAPLWARPRYSGCVIP